VEQERAKRLNEEDDVPCGCMEAISHARRLAEVIWLGKYDGQNLMLFTAYFDDSGSDSANPALVLAGFVAPVDGWSNFTADWDAVLDKPPGPLPARMAFHAKQFDDGRRGHGPYGGWSEDQRREYLGSLLAAIGRHALKSFAVILQKDALGEVTQNAEDKAFFGSPYGVCSFLCLQRVCGWRDREHPDTKVMFVFDRGHANEGELLVKGAELRRGDKLIADLTTDDDEKEPPLQAADLLAFELCADARRAYGGSPRISRFPLLTLESHPHEWINPGAADLRDIRAGSGGRYPALSAEAKSRHLEMLKRSIQNGAVDTSQDPQFEIEEEPAHKKPDV